MNKLETKEVSIRDLPMPIVLMLVTIAMPEELSFFVGQLRITPTRLILLILFFSIISKILSRKKELHERYLIGFSLWVLISLAFNHGPQSALESGGVFVLEIIISYYVAKTYIQKDIHIYSLLKLFRFITMGLLPFLIIENVTGKHLIHDFFRAGTGFSIPLKDEIRMGLTRAYGPFSHPILSGVFFSTFLGFIWYSSKLKFLNKLKQLIFLIIAVLTALSSAPMLAVIIQVSAIFWNWYARLNKKRWKTVAYGIATVYIFLSFWSDSTPLMAILRRITLDPQTAYFRTLIWTYGSDEVIRHPIMGIGFNDWVRPIWMHTASVDSFFLVQAMRHGFVGVLLLILSIFFLVKKMVSFINHKETSKLQMITTGWIVSMVSLVLMGFTVDFFGTNRPLFFFMMGIGASILKMQQLAIKK
jgi:O-antigen ligase